MNPIRLNNFQELEVFAIEMKISATKSKISHEKASTIESAIKNEHGEIAYSKSIKEALERITPEVRKIIDESPTMQLIIYNDIPMTIGITCEKIKEEEIWHLSMGVPTPSGVPNRVPDNQTVMIAKAFFPKGCIEHESPTVFKNVRHFICKKEK